MSKGLAELFGFLGEALITGRIPDNGEPVFGSREGGSSSSAPAPTPFSVSASSASSPEPSAGPSSPEPGAATCVRCDGEGEVVSRSVIVPCPVCRASSGKGKR